MAEAHDGAGSDGFAVPLRLHNLLLALAGRIDDSALSDARELVARAHLDEAVELIVGTLIAGQISVRSAEQRELALALELSRSDATLADDLSVQEAEPDIRHRFTADNQPERGIAEALQKTVQVLPDLRTVHAVWRNTPAGSVSGPLPQRVVLVEIGPEGNPPAVAFRVYSALRRAGIRCVVEVAGPGAHGTAYHDSALGAATAVWLSGATSSAPSSGGSRESGPRQSGAAVARSHAAQAQSPAKSPKRVPGRHLAEDAAPVTEPVPVVSDAAPEPAAAKADKGGSKGKQASAPNPPKQPVEYSRVESTTDLSSAEVAQLRRALAEDPERGKAIAAARTGEDVVDLPALDLDDPQLSDRDRQLLRELHAELAERERAEAARVNGSNGSEQRSWNGFSSS